jgi:outer membrane autotransporter protein
MPVMAYGEDGPRPVAPDSPGPVAWGHAFGSWGSFDGDGNAAAMDTSTGGFLAGIDGEIGSAIRLGFLTGYSHSTFDVDGRASSGSSDNYHLGLYAGGKWNALRLTGGLAYTWHDIETGRSVALPGFSDSLTEDYGAGTFQAFGEAGYKIGMGAASFEPFANLAYVSLHTDGFTEKGGVAALHVRGGTTDTTFTTLGIHLSSAFDLGGMKATARGTLGWRHAFGEVTPLSTHAFAGGDPFDIAGVPIAKDAALVEAGLDLNLTEAATLGVAYQGQFGSRAVQNGFNARLAIRF